MSPWLIIVIVGVGTIITRLSFIGILGRFGVPAFIERPLRFVAPAALAAIAIPAVVAPEGAVDVGVGSLRLVAALVAILVAWKTRAIGPTIVAGMVSLWQLDWLF